MITKCWTDGACSHNGKSHARAGFAALIGNKIYSGRMRSCVYELVNGKITTLQKEVKVTNIRAELLAIIVALRYARGEQIEIITDSQFSIDAITSWLEGWEKKGYFGTNSRKNMDLFEIIYILQKKFADIKYTFQPSHVKNPTTENEINNALVDKEAVKGMNKENYKVSILDLASL